MFASLFLSSSVSLSPGLPWILIHLFALFVAFFPLTLLALYLRARAFRGVRYIDSLGFHSPLYSASLYWQLLNIVAVMAAFASSIPEPSVSELVSFQDGSLELMVETIGFVGDHSDPASVPGSLFVLIAGNAADVPDITMSDLAGISYDELEALMQEWTPPPHG